MVRRQTNMCGGWGSIRMAVVAVAWLLAWASCAARAADAQLTIRAHDQDSLRVEAKVAVDGRAAGDAWSPIVLAAGTHLVVVEARDRRWSGRILLLSGERSTLDVTLETAIPMVLIPPGSFLMGSPEDEPGRLNDECRHLVTLTRWYWIGTTEVSQALYEDVIGSNPSRWVDPARPVENVSWFDCVRFCNLLSRRHGLQPAYTVAGDHVGLDPAADGYRLPTEAEWEYAGRAGAETRYGFGDDPGELYRHGNYCDRACERAWCDTTRLDGHAFTAPIASYAPNAWGLHDMHGNVWEWCWDWWAPFDGSARVDPQGPAAGGRKAERGGCWEAGPGMCRLAYRHYVEPDQKRSYLGFRIVRTQP